MPWFLFNSSSSYISSLIERYVSTFCLKILTSSLGYFLLSVLLNVTVLSGICIIERRSPFATPLFTFDFAGSVAAWAFCSSGKWRLGLQCTGFSLPCLLLQSTGSRVRGLSRRGPRALEHRLSTCSTPVQLPYGIWNLLRPGIKPLCHQGNPSTFNKISLSLFPDPNIVG